jgi:hypothetical protein
VETSRKHYYGLTTDPDHLSYYDIRSRSSTTSIDISYDGPRAVRF